MSMTATKKLIGLSLSFCIKDILLGRVKEDEVFMLYCKADPTSQEMLRQYMQSYWSDFTMEDVRALLDRMKPKIHQLHHALRIPLGIWYDATQPHHWVEDRDGLVLEGTVSGY
jgi:hypothetical protein